MFLILSKVGDEIHLGIGQTEVTAKQDSFVGLYEIYLSHSCWNWQEIGIMNL